MKKVYICSRFFYKGRVLTSLKYYSIMPKMKTNSSAKKRFKVTGSGKIKRRHAFKSHILTKKSKKRKRRLTKATIVDKTEVRRIKLMLNI